MYAQTHTDNLSVEGSEAVNQQPVIQPAHLQPNTWNTAGCSLIAIFANWHLHLAQTKSKLVLQFPLVL
jgi:hypothetical protein